MNNIANTLIIAGGISIMSFIGALLTSGKSKTWFFKNNHLLVVFAAGVFTITSLNLMSEVFEFLSNQYAILTIVGGFVGMLILHKILPETHHHHNQECENCQCECHSNVTCYVDSKRRHPYKVQEPNKEENRQ